MSVISREAREKMKRTVAKSANTDRAHELNYDIHRIVSENYASQKPALEIYTAIAERFKKIDLDYVGKSTRVELIPAIRSFVDYIGSKDESFDNRKAWNELSLKEITAVGQKPII